jgi:hypothetical protein
MGAASELESLGVKVSSTHLTHLTKSYPFESIKHVGYYAVQTAQVSGEAFGLSPSAPSSIRRALGFHNSAFLLMRARGSWARELVPMNDHSLVAQSTW